METVENVLEGQLGFNLFSDDTLTEQLSIFDTMALKDLEEIWGKVKTMYDGKSSLSKFFISLDCFDSSGREREKLISVRELCIKNESLVEQYIKHHLNKQE